MSNKHTLLEVYCIPVQFDNIEVPMLILVTTRRALSQFQSLNIRGRTNIM